MRGDGELSSVPGPSLWSMPWARDPGESARPRNNGRRQILPSASGNTSASRQDKISGLILTALLPCCLRFNTHQSPGEWQDSLLTCLLDFPDVISVNPSLGAWASATAVPRSARACFFLHVSGLPPYTIEVGFPLVPVETIS